MIHRPRDKEVDRDIALLRSPLQIGVEFDRKTDRRGNALTTLFRTSHSADVSSTVLASGGCCEQR